MPENPKKLNPSIRVTKIDGSEEKVVEMAIEEYLVELSKKVRRRVRRDSSIVWVEQFPILLVSVVGGGENFSMSRRDQLRLTHCLQRLVSTEGVWLFTGGTNLGIDRLFRQPLQDHHANVNRTASHKQ